MQVTYTPYATRHASDPMELESVIHLILAIPGWRRETVIATLNDDMIISTGNGYYQKVPD